MKTPDRSVHITPPTTTVGRVVSVALCTAVGLAVFTMGCGARSSLSVATEAGDAATTPTPPTPPPAACSRGLLTSSAAKAGFAVDTAFVYYVDRVMGGIARISKAGGQAELIASETRTVLNVVVDAMFVYWSAGTESDTNVYKAAKVPGSARETLRSVPKGIPASFAQPFSFLLAIDDRFVTAEGGGTVRWIDKVSPIYGWRSSAPQHGPYDWTSRGLTSDGSYAYWATGTFVARARLGFANSETELVLAISEDRVRAFAVDDKNLYWLWFNGWDHDLSRASKDGTNPEPFLHRVRDAAIALDTELIYVTTDAGLVAASKTTRTITVIEPKVVAHAIVADADCIYYLARGDSETVSLSRTPRR